MTLTLAGYVLGKPDSFGVTWHHLLEGWDDGPEMRSTAATQVGVPGAAKGEWTYNPRAVVLRGMADCPSESAMWTAIERLAQLSDATEAPVELRVQNALRTLACQVLRDGAPKSQPLTDRVFEYQVPFSALDPIKYDVTVKHDTTTVTTTHQGRGIDQNGTAKRCRAISMTLTGRPGGATGFSLHSDTDANAQLDYNNVVDNGETVVFDFRAGWAFSSTRGFTTASIPASSQFPDLLRGSNAFWMWTGAGSVDFDFAWSDGYI